MTRTAALLAFVVALAGAALPAATPRFYNDDPITREPDRRARCLQRRAPARTEQRTAAESRAVGADSRKIDRLCARIHREGWQRRNLVPVVRPSEESRGSDGCDGRRDKTVLGARL